LRGLSDAIPQFTWDRVRVHFITQHVRSLKKNGKWDLACDMSRAGKVTNAQIAADPGRYLAVVRSNTPTLQLLNAMREPATTAVVWSMWGGYWEDDRYLRPWCEEHGVERVSIHSGGHASPADLQRVVDAIQPRRLVWVHTEANGRGTERIAGLDALVVLGRREEPV
jgi:ribonuclease J